MVVEEADMGLASLLLALLWNAGRGAAGSEEVRATAAM